MADKTKKELERILGMFVYYSKWIRNFAEIANPLFEAKKNSVFPLSDECIAVIEKIKSEISKSTLSIPMEGELLTLETDASLQAIG